MFPVVCFLLHFLSLFTAMRTAYSIQVLSHPFGAGGPASETKGPAALMVTRLPGHVTVHVQWGLPGLSKPEFLAEARSVQNSTFSMHGALWWRLQQTLKKEVSCA